MTSLFEAFQSFLQRHFEAEIAPLEDGNLVFRMEDEEGHEWGCLGWVVEELGQVMFYSVLLETTPADRLDELMRFTTMANYNMQIGNFELDLDDGEVRFKTSIDVDEATLSDALFRNLVEVNLAMMSRYYTGLVAVLHGALTAREAISAIEDGGGPLYEN